MHVRWPLPLRLSDSRYGTGTLLTTPALPKPSPSSRSRGSRSVVSDVDEDIYDEDHHRDDPDERFDQGDIARRHRVERQPTDPGIRENALDDHRASEQEANLQTGERQRRQRGVAQRVADQDPGPGESFCPRRADVIGA